MSNCLRVHVGGLSMLCLLGALLGGKLCSQRV
jgi:hypothetical protein